MGRLFRTNPPSDAPHIAALRPEFERWASNMGYRVDRTRYEWIYKDRRTYYAWIGWVAKAERQFPSKCASAG